MAIQGEQVAAAPLVGGGETVLHSHIGGGLRPLDVSLVGRGDALALFQNMPAALTDFNGLAGTHFKLDLSGFTQARLTGRVGVAGVASAQLRVQYSTDDATWSYLDGAAGPAMYIDMANTTRVGSWVTLAAGALADVFLRLVGIGGNGVLDPTFGVIHLQLM